MAKADIYTILHSRNLNPEQFSYENMWIPGIENYLTMYDIAQIREAITSVSLMSKNEVKYKLIDNIMSSRGFKRLAGGTNRVVYRYLEDTRFVAKIAIDKIGMQANLLEYYAQNYIKPYCAKMFNVTQCGTIALSERVMAITSKAEFKAVARDIYQILINKIIGNYVVDDIGTEFFLNYGIRSGHGPVLLDYPYVYPLNGNSLYCNRLLSDGRYCNGEIDYDSGLNYLKCVKCGKRYFARDLKLNPKLKPILKRGGLSTMKVTVKRGDEVIVSSVKNSDVIQPFRQKQQSKPCKMRVIVKRGDEVIIDNGIRKNIEESEQEKEVQVSVHKDEEEIECKVEEADDAQIEIPKEDIEEYEDTKEEAEEEIEETPSAVDLSDDPIERNRVNNKRNKKNKKKRSHNQIRTNSGFIQ